MGTRFIQPGELGVELSKIIEEYTEEVSAAIEEEIDKTANDLKEEIQATAPKRKGKHGGKYSKGFAIKKENGGGSTSRIIYNKSKPGLVHLLELGHAKRGGKGRVEARPHLRPAYDKIVPKMEREIEDIIKRGGK